MLCRLQVPTERPAVDRLAVNRGTGVMIRMRSFRAACRLALLGAALAISPAAHANIIAAVEQPAGGSRTDLDIALYDATTGTRLSLPSSVNTTDDELHPSLTPDGRRLVFERSNATPEPTGS